MPEYVPYEERQRRRSVQQEQERDENARTARALADEVARLLRTLGGRWTNCHLELLEPMPHRYRGNKTVVRDHGLMIRGRGHRYDKNAPCLIEEVVAAYRIPRAIHGSPGKDGYVMVLDAFVAPDGRCWRFGGGTPGDGVYQPLRANGYPVESNSVANLERIILGLRTISAA